MKWTQSPYIPFWTQNSIDPEIWRLHNKPGPYGSIAYIIALNETGSYDVKSIIGSFLGCAQSIEEAKEHILHYRKIS